MKRKIKQNYYAGIGARKTPDDVCEQMTRIGTWMAEEGWILRSGSAKGADAAFERGCDLANGDKEIFLPRAGYNGSKSLFYSPSPEAYNLIDDTWKDVKRKSPLVRALLARNCQQILGEGMQEPAKVVICWTRNGEAVGGTGRAIQIARKAQIPVINLYEEQFHEINTKADFLKAMKKMVRNNKR